MEFEICPHCNEVHTTRFCPVRDTAQLDILITRLNLDPLQTFTQMMQETSIDVKEDQ